MGKYEVVVLDGRKADYSLEKGILAEIGADLTIYNGSMDVASLKKVFAHADALLVHLTAITKDLIEMMPKVRVISRYGVGYDNIDVKSADDAGIFVATVPDYWKTEVPEHALALLLACARQIPQRDLSVRASMWRSPRTYPMTRISGKTLGIIGYGRSGSLFHNITKSLDFSQTLVYTRSRNPGETFEKGRFAMLEEVLSQSDYISLHLPLSAQTKHMISAKNLALMKPSAVLINTSRGEIIDELALANALRNKQIRSAGLDVFAKEPLPSTSPLLGLDNVVFSDHQAYYSVEAYDSLKQKAAENIVFTLETGQPHFAINSPARPRLGKESVGLSSCNS